MAEVNKKNTRTTGLKLAVPPNHNRPRPPGGGAQTQAPTLWAQARSSSYLLCSVDRGELDEVLDADEAVSIPVQGVKHRPEAGDVLRTPCGLAREAAGLA